jgi:hypothetical protein
MAKAQNTTAVRTRVIRLSGNMVVRLRNTTAVWTRVIRLKTHKVVWTHCSKAQKYYDCLPTWHKAQNTTAVRTRVIRLSEKKVVRLRNNTAVRTRVIRLSENMVVRLRNNTAVRTRVIRIKTHKAVGTHGGMAQNTTAVWPRGTRLRTTKTVGTENIKVGQDPVNASVLKHLCKVTTWGTKAKYEYDIKRPCGKLRNRPAGIPWWRRW